MASQQQAAVQSADAELAESLAVNQCEDEMQQPVAAHHLCGAHAGLQRWSEGEERRLGAEVG